MRIRKNAKLSPLMFLAVESVPQVLQTNVCQLNQSPWDVIPFDQHATNQLEEAEDSFNGNTSLGDSIGAVDSVASMMDGSAKLSNNNIIITDENEVMAGKDGDNCDDLDENGDRFEKLVDSSWKCKKQFREEDYSSFSSDHRHRRTLSRSSENNCYSTPNNSSCTKKSAAGDTAWRLTRPARASKKAVSAAAVGGSNPYEFYYYSGFGPQWGKKRRERGGGEDGRRSSENTMGIRSNAITPSEIDGEELDYVEDDDDDEEEEEDGEGDGGKKRTRKPVKARSLKSLM